MMINHKGVRRFRGPNLAQIALPMGGIGAGCVCLSGIGSLQDFSIHNRPATSAMPDGHAPAAGAVFAVLRVAGPGSKAVTRLVEGPMPRTRIYDQGLQSQGLRQGGQEGLPRFDRCTFVGAYPFGQVLLTDPNVPVKVALTGWSPMIPLDDVNSSIPCAILEYTLTSRARRPVGVELSGHLAHSAIGPRGDKGTRNRGIEGGVLLYNVEPAGHESFGSLSLTTFGHRPRVKAMWFRGGWFDATAALWAELHEGRFRANDGAGESELEGRNGGSILVEATLKPGQSVTIPLVITWHFPNVNYVHGQPPGKTDAACGPGCDCDAAPAPKWRPFYAGRWTDAADVAAYVRANAPSLRARTLAFAEAIFGSTAPPEVIDAVSANLAILKSPTVLRQENGNVWAWEGCFPGSGCCHGSCTHVWNYAQAMPHLFPALERTLREQELDRSMDESGHVNFRSALPDGPVDHGWHAAADGQLGGAMKLYRDWQIGGDMAWMERLYPLARRSLEWAIAKWDPEQRGLLFEPHHNTYDIEFWGPDGMCSSIYLGALSAMAAMAKALGRADDEARYRGLARNGAKLMDELLFDGGYYRQRVMWKELRDQSFARQVARESGGDETMELLKRQGPKYQYGNGCLSDGVIGAWMARIYGIDTPQNQRHVRAALRAIYRHNWRADLAAHACTQRPGYAMGHEGGLVLCTWPRGDKPTLPFPYSDEVWTGIEYQVASHLIEEGMVKEGLNIVRAARGRYDGLTRNPWNEYECGSYYARAMSSYALLGSLSGFRYSAVEKTLRLAPQLPRRPFETFFCTAGGFGTVRLERRRLVVRMIEGEMPIRRLIVRDGRRSIDMHCEITATTRRPAVAVTWST